MDGLPEELGHYGSLSFVRDALLLQKTITIGLELARLADLPSDVIEEGRKVATVLADLHARGEEESQTTITATRRRAVLRVRYPVSLLMK